MKESEARLRSYFEIPVVGIAITSLDKGWLEVNPALCDMFGYSQQELSCMTWAELTHPDDLAADVAQFNKVLAGEIDTYSMEKRFIRENGSIFWTTLSVSCVRKPDGSVDYTVALLQNITIRKQLEEEREKLISDLQKALSEVKKLSGFLPICASCKKIRDDQGYWNQIEEYISDHSEAQFSHGICPDCMRKLYPEIADDILGELEKDEKKQ